MVLDAYPVVAAGMLASFLVVTTPTMHDVWNAPEDQQQNEMINFQKTVGSVGASARCWRSGAPNGATP